MEIEVKVDVNAPVEKVWKVVSDIEHSDKVISAIQKIEVLDRGNPSAGGVGEAGLVPLTPGFKWKETRTMFGKTAEETMTVTEAVENSHYITEAESHGSRYKSKISVEDKEGATELKMAFEATPVSLMAKVLWVLLARLFMGGTRRALQQDLEDVKKHAEGGS